MVGDTSYFDTEDFFKDIPTRDIAKDSAQDLPSGDVNLDTISSARLSNALASHAVSVRFNNASISLQIPTLNNNSLPFLSASYQRGDPTLRHLNLDLWIEGDTLQISRSSAPAIEGEEVRVSGSVVAFDPSRMAIECSTFRTANVDTSVIIAPVDLSRTFLNLWYKINTGTNNKNVAFMSAHFKTPTEIFFERHGPDGIIEGHFCVSRAVNQSFSVQHLSSQMNAGQTMISIPIDPIDPSASLLFLSHQATRLQSSPGYSQVACELLSNEIRCHRSLGENEITDIHLQVVQFSERSQVSHYKVEIADGEPQTRLVDPTIEKSDSVIFGPMGMLGEVATDGDSKIKVPGSFVEAIVEDGSILFRRGDPEKGKILVYPQVVKW